MPRAAASLAGSPVDPRVAELRYATAIGAQRTEVLPDGSIVKLNTATRVVVRQDARERRVDVLDGEAHFEVRHDPSRPFVVTAAGRRIRAVGTAFNVRLESDGAVLVTVTEGRVRVTAGPADAAPSSGSAETEVTAGEGLFAAAAGADGWRVESLDRETLSNRLAWQRGMLVFEGEPLEAALREVSRYADVRFEIRDEAVRQVRIGGVYKSGDIDGLVQSLERNFGVVATRRADGVVVISSR
jgi:transmembrane sensor